MEMGDKIRKLRQDRGLTLQQVADMVGVGKSTVLKWESGKIENMGRDKIKKLADALSVTPGYLMGWEDAPTPEKTDEEELWQLREELRRRPEMRMLFSLARGATSEDLKKAVAIIEALQRTEEQPEAQDDDV